jgi:sulfur relay (sulfurtransferase) DsrC/TusE family protein
MNNNNCNVELTNNEMWKILDAITAYKKDYAVSVPVQKIIKGIEKKLRIELKK